MTETETMRLALNLHTRCMVQLIDSLDEHTPREKLLSTLAMLRDEALEFKKDFMPFLERLNKEHP